MTGSAFTPKHTQIILRAILAWKVRTGQMVAPVKVG
jgi:hypothetical protein